MSSSIKNKITQFTHEGFFHIFGSSVLAKLGGIISSIVVIRHLPKIEYGNYVEAENLYAYFAIFIGFGISTSLIQYCSENISDAQKNSIYRLSLKIGFLGNFILVPLIILSAVLKYYTGSLATGLYLPLFILLPFFTFIDYYQQYVLRVNLDNKSFGITNTIYTIVHVAGNILFTLLFGVVGLIISQYFAHIVSASYSLTILRKSRFYRTIYANSETLNKEFKKEFLSYSLVSALTTFASTALTLIDVTCLDHVLNDAEILADYKVALTIPSALLFIPKSFMTYFFPKLVRAFSQGKESGTKEMRQFIIINILLNSAICLCVFLFAPLMIDILYGDKYMNVTPVFRILVVNYFFASLRLVTSQVINTLKKVKINLLFTIISGILNITVNLLFIPIWNSEGAAIATVATSIIILLANIFYLILYFKKVGNDDKIL